MLKYVRINSPSFSELRCSWRVFDTINPTMIQIELRNMVEISQKEKQLTCSYHTVHCGTRLKAELLRPRQVCSGWRWPRKWATASAELQVNVKDKGVKDNQHTLCLRAAALPCSTCSDVRCPHLCKRTVAPWFACLDDSKGYGNNTRYNNLPVVYCNVCTHELLHMLLLHGLGQHTRHTHSTHTALHTHTPSRQHPQPRL